MEAEKIIDEQEGEGEERRALRLLLGGKLLRKRRMRRLLLANLRTPSATVDRWFRLSKTGSSTTTCWRRSRRRTRAILIGHWSPS